MTGHGTPKMTEVNPRKALRQRRRREDLQAPGIHLRQAVDHRAGAECRDKRGYLRDRDEERR